MGSGFEPRYSGSAVLYSDCSSTRQGCKPSGLRNRWITKGRNWFDLVRNWISLLRTFLRCLWLSKIKIAFGSMGMRMGTFGLLRIFTMVISGDSMLEFAQSSWPVIACFSLLRTFLEAGPY